LNGDWGWGLNHFGHWVWHKFLLGEELLGSNCNLFNIGLSNGDCGECWLSNDCGLCKRRLGGKLGSVGWAWSNNCGSEWGNAGCDDGGGSEGSEGRGCEGGCRNDGCCESSRGGTAHDGSSKEFTIDHSISSIQGCCCTDSSNDGRHL
jgi:hypothetical protein